MSKIEEHLLEGKFASPQGFKKYFNLPERRFFHIVKRDWYELENPRFMGGSIHLKYEDEWMYYEVCDTRYKRGRYCGKNNLTEVVHNQVHKPEKDQHISTFSHCYRWQKHVRNTKKLSGVQSKVESPLIWIELDRESLEKSISDAWLIARRFPYPEHMRFWFSGNKSIHIGVNAELFGNPIGWGRDVAGRGKLFYNLATKIAGDVRHSNKLADPYFISDEELQMFYEGTFGEFLPKGPNGKQEARQRLENLDPSLYSVNSLIRMPYSIHEKTGKQKIEVCLDDLAKYKLRQIKPRQFPKTKPHLLEWTFECYQKKEKPQREVDLSSYEKNVVVQIVGKYFDGFNPQEANSDGYVTDLKNPMYNDTRGSCSVNINTGLIHDFGNDQVFDLPDLVGQMEKIGRKKAKYIISQYES